MDHLRSGVKDQPDQHGETHFEINVGSHAVVRNDTESPPVCFPNGNIFKTIAQFDIVIDIVKYR